MMREPFALSSLLAVFGLSACSPPPPSSSAAATSAPPAAAEETERGEPADPRFIGRIWHSTTPGSARGTILVFLPDRTLLMGSCSEPYRISQWGAAGDRIRWIEDTIPIEATLSMPAEKELRLQVAGQDRVQSYMVASVPFTCPDMPR